MKRPYWYYKCNKDGGPAGFYGVWTTDVFASSKAQEWGGHEASLSPEVWNYLDYDVRSGDGVVCYQTDTKRIVGFCEVVDLRGKFGDKKIVLRPTLLFPKPLDIHKAKKGTLLEHNAAVNGRVMMRPIEQTDVEIIRRLANVGGHDVTPAKRRTQDSTV